VEESVKQKHLFLFRDVNPWILQSADTSYSFRFEQLSQEKSKECMVRIELSRFLLERWWSRGRRGRRRHCFPLYFGSRMSGGESTCPFPYVPSLERKFDWSVSAMRISSGQARL
jgi:hypothetical protein